MNPSSVEIKHHHYYRNKCMVHALIKCIWRGVCVLCLTRSVVLVIIILSLGPLASFNQWNDQGTNGPLFGDFV